MPTPAATLINGAAVLTDVFVAVGFLFSAVVIFIAWSGGKSTARWLANWAVKMFKR